MQSGWRRKLEAVLQLTTRQQIPPLGKFLIEGTTADVLTESPDLLNNETNWADSTQFAGGMEMRCSNAKSEKGSSKEGELVHVGQ